MKIAFFDIDGTLIDFGAPGISHPVIDALNQLHNQGVKLFLATGRPPYFIPEFPEIPFDGALCFNGSYCYNKDEVIFSQPLHQEDVHQIIHNAAEMNEPVLIASETRYGANAYSQTLHEYMAISHNTCKVVDDYDNLKKENVYQLMVATKAHQDEQLLKDTKHSTTTRWWSEAVDIIPDNCSKAKGMEKILSYYGFNREDSISFGDGGNDLEMIQYAGIGVAMGNALKEVQEQADYVTDTCSNDGVVTALKHFQLI